MPTTSKALQAVGGRSPLLYMGSLVYQNKEKLGCIYLPLTHVCTPERDGWMPLHVPYTCSLSSVTFRLVESERNT